MAKTKRSRRSSRAKRGISRAEGERRGPTDSLGAGLDEIGFRPLGRRIIVGRPTVSDDGARPSGLIRGTVSRNPGYIATEDDQFGNNPFHPLKVAKSALSDEDDPLPGEF